MNHILAITKKELRAYFLSPVALIFLAIFLIATLFTFFWVETFFSRNLADIRPLFTWLPVLLIFLCSVLTMRLWSEEQKLGTHELLLTLPVEIHHLILGKFLASLGLVAIALALTLGVPITVSMIGDLDWGPVFGGYFGALLLAGAYLAIGLCISASTENQIVSLLISSSVCGLFYRLGTESVAGVGGNRWTEFFQSLGMGSRFESIRRGVIDLRDVLYYVTFIVVFLLLNTVILRAKRWSNSAEGRPRRVNAVAMVALVTANMLGLNILFASLGVFRLDLTERREYSISETTKNLIRSLDEPLLIRGYFSAKTHPLLAPMIPRIQDLVKEYAILSHGKVRTEFLDPKDDEDSEKEANQAYGIQSFPFRVSDRHEMGVVNSYFSVLVKYGDQFETLSFEDLIEVQVSGQNDIEVKLRNLEYDLTRAIKKVAYGFQSIDAVFAELEQPAEFTAFITPKTLPENFKEIPSRIQKVVTEIEKQSGGKFKYQIIDPDEGAEGGAPSKREELFKVYGFKPFASSLFSQDTFYLHLLMKIGSKYERVFPAESMSEADIKNEVLASLKRGAPGFLKTIGLVKPADPQPPHPQFPGQPPPPPPQDFTRMIRQKMSENYTVKDVDLKEGRVPGDVDVLLVFAPKDYDDRQRFAFDQYLMRGGAVIVLGGKFELNPQSQEGISVNKVRTGLEDVLASYGVTVQDSMVLDPQNEAFPLPRIRDLGGIKVREIQRLDYPFFIDIRSTGMSKDSPVVSGLPAVTLQWASPITVTQVSLKDAKEKEGASGEASNQAGGETGAREVVTLLRSTDKAWTQSDPNVQPPETGFVAASDRKSYDLAVAIKGNFESYFKDRPSPLFGGDDSAGGAAPGGDRTGRTLKQSPATARLVVVGSSNFVNDLVLNLSRQVGSDRFQNNVQLAQNLVDWAVEDVDLLAIRSRGTYARTLYPLDSKTKDTYEGVNYGIAVLALFGLVLFTAGRRRRMVPIDLEPSGGRPRPSPPRAGSGISSNPTEAT